MMIDIGTDHAFEFSMTYNLEDEGVSRNLEHYAAICEKVNQSIQVLWRLSGS
jgi:hypothetical protein